VCELVKGRFERRGGDGVDRNVAGGGVWGCRSVLVGVLTPGGFVALALALAAVVVSRKDARASIDAGGLGVR
jgi:hypothetical protein